ncbi:MAG: BACON domain-containing carbohydrate-binding protein [Bacteroidota bacterium]
MKKLILLALITLLIVISPIGRAFAVKHIISVQNYSFTPASIPDVVVGDTIRWVWVSGSHTTTSTTIPASAATWNSPISSTTTTYDYKVTLAGTYNYKCTPHAAMGMVGSFVASAPAATLSVLPANQNVQSAAGSTTFSVISNSSWSAHSNSAWCTVNTSGNGNGQITATYSANLALSPRTAAITVSVAGLPSQEVTVTQAAASATLSIDPVNQDVGYQAGITNFNVSSNTNWTASSGSAWCTVTPSGSGNGVMTATFTENNTFGTRLATITLNVQGLNPKEVTITQALSSVSVNETPENNFGIYPNPSKGSLTVTTGTGKAQSVQIHVLNAIGALVYNAKEAGSDRYLFNLSSLAKGTYVIQVISAEGMKTSKLELVN